MIRRLLKLIPELSRFSTVAITGLAIDLLIAWALVEWIGFEDTLAAGCGLVVGLVFAYGGHQMWTFRGLGTKAPVVNFLMFSFSAGITLLIRIGSLSAIDALGLKEYIPTILRLGFSAGLSFIVSYLLCSSIIWSTRRPESE